MGWVRILSAHPFWERRLSNLSQLWSPGATFLCCGQSGREVIRGRQPFREKLPWPGESCFVFPSICVLMQHCFFFLLSTAFNFSCKSGRDAVLSQWRCLSQAKLLVVTEISISSAGLWSSILLQASCGHTWALAACCATGLYGSRVLGGAAHSQAGELTGRAPYWEGSRGKSLRAGIKTACLAVLSPLWLMQTCDIFCIRFPIVVI